MAIDVCSEISISPRISFSHDLNQTSSSDQHHVQRLDSTLLDSDFDFGIGNNNSFNQHLSSADELFSNGKILPIQIKKQSITTTTAEQTHHQPNESSSSSISSNTEKKKRLKEFLTMSIDDDEKKTSSKSFWQFKRSSSLNCESSRSKSLIRSLQFLSRSNSTGSAPNPTKPVISQKQNLQRQPSVSRKSSSSSSSSGTYYFYNSNSTTKPPLKKSYGNGIRISPVLNIPPPFISNPTVSLFGLGSLFCNGKVLLKKKKR